LPNYYERHRGSAQCTKNKKKWKENEIVKRTKSMAMSFFGPRPSKVPATVTAPPPIQPASFVPPKSDLSETLSEKNDPKPIRGCPFALQLLTSLHKRIESLPKDTKEAGIDHPLAGFSVDPTGCVEDGEDAWEKWDGPLNTLLQKDPEELNRLVVVGQRGLRGLHRFLLYLVSEHGIQGSLLEGKLEWLFAAIDRA
jgi:hypothetical protein